MKKQKPLVLQHLENISGRVLGEYPRIIRQMIRGRAGIYVLYRRGKLYYVGLARNLMGRLKTHLGDRHRGLWDRFSVYLTVHDEHIKELESLLLSIINLSGNTATGRFANSVNLTPSLLRSMKEYDADRYALLIGGHVARRRRQTKTKHGGGSIALAGVVDRRFALKALYHGKDYRAMLRRDGRISFRKKLYDTPTGAAKAAIGRSCNGWSFWRYRNEKSNWVRLSEIRQ